MVSKSAGSAKRDKAKAAPAGSKTPVKTAVKKPRARPQKTVVREIRKQIEEKLTHGVEKATLADYIRLVQLEKELTGTTPKETKATWVDPKELGTEEPVGEPEGEAGAEESSSEK